METFCELLALCVTGEFPHKGQWRGALMFSLNKRLSKQSWGWWFGTPSRPLWRHCNGAQHCPLCVTGVSHHTQYLVDIAAVQNWFDVRRGLAIGLLMSAASVGSFVWSPLASTLIQYYDWRGAMLIISGIQLNGVVFGLFLRKFRAKTVRTTIGKDIVDIKAIQTLTIVSDTNSEDKSRWKRFIPFGLLLVSVGLIQAGFFVYITYLPMRMDELGFEKRKVSLLFSLIGAAGIILRPLVGVISDSRYVSRVALYGICAILGGALSVASLWFHTTATLAFYAVGCGVTACKYLRMFNSSLAPCIDFLSVIKTHWYGNKTRIIHLYFTKRWDIEIWISYYHLFLMVACRFSRFMR